MKLFKLKAKHYKDIVQLLIDVGASDMGKDTKGITLPNHVYSSKADMKKMKAAVTKAFVKQYPYLKGSKKLQTSVGMHMLNYSPNESLAEAIKPGYVLVDDKAIALELKGYTEKIS